MFTNKLQKFSTFMLENGSDLKLGKGLIAMLWKPKKTKGEIKNIRPIILLKIIRKILSNITLTRIKSSINNYVSPYQSAYRNNRSTTDIVWCYRWIIAKIQIYVNMKLFIVGTDLSSAFDTIDRNELINVLSTIIGPDELRMSKCLLADTELELKMPGVDTESFKSNIGSPQGDGISGPFFNIIFETALRELRECIISTVPRAHPDHNYTHSDIIPATLVPSNNSPTDHNYTTTSIFHPNETQYADDSDFLTMDINQRNNIVEFSEPILTKHNLCTNKSKTELTTLLRGKKMNEQWRHVKKLGSLLGDREDIARRKSLAAAQMKSLQKLWIKNNSVSLYTRVTLFNTLVKSVLLYNSSTWGLSKSDENNLNSFHRRLLRKLCNIKWPEIIHNKELYKKTKTYPISIDITTSRWKYFGHSLRMANNTPPKHAMLWFFEPVRDCKKYSGKQRTTIFSTIQRDIHETKLKFPNFSIDSFDTASDFEHISSLAANRVLWRRITKAVVDAAKAKYSF